MKGSLPDVALCEADSNVLALPVEVKPSDTNMDRLVAWAQAAKDARDLGAGTVLLTNVCGRWETGPSRGTVSSRRP
jgi:hypothetical protein